MRVSTTTIFEQGISNIQRGQATVLNSQNHISANKRVLTPSDDPVAAARVLEVSQSKAINQQYARNTDSATSAIGLEENALARYGTLIQDIKTLTVQAGNGALSERELESIATEIRGRYQELLGVANATDGNGLYLFSGFRGDTQPFTENAPGVVAYNGDQGQRLIQITASRQVAVSDSGTDAFQRIRTGNGTFETAAGGTNTGTGVVTEGRVTDASAWNAAANPQDFEVQFFVDSSGIPVVRTYDIVDPGTGLSIITGAAPAAGVRTYNDGAEILLSRLPTDPAGPAFDYGVSLAVTGEPADGDTFNVTPSEHQDIFATVYALITALETAGSGPTSNTRLANALNTAQNNLDNALDVSLTVRAAVGSRMKEIETAKSTADDLTLQYDSTLSDLQDLDYAKALSELTFQQMSLEAAQKTFLQVQRLSLFEYL
ncbi:MAG: flagellar hook-associated protein FlgL [Burkholderiales bacterium]|nr:flagellar hook-associated protein FlgL [Burkholderiales bacterium]